MPQHAPYRTPLVEFVAWLASATYRPVVALVDLVEWFGIALVDALERRTRWVRTRIRARWRWQATVALAMIAAAAVTMVSLR